MERAALGPVALLAVEEADSLEEKIPDAAGALADIGVGVVNSIFAGVTIFILMFSGKNFL